MGSRPDGLYISGRGRLDIAGLIVLAVAHAAGSSSVGRPWTMGLADAMGGTRWARTLEVAGTCLRIRRPPTRPSDLPPLRWPGEDPGTAHPRHPPFGQQAKAPDIAHNDCFLCLLGTYAGTHGRLFSHFFHPGQKVWLRSRGRASKKGRSQTPDNTSLGHSGQQNWSTISPSLDDAGPAASSYAMSFR